MWSVFVCVLNTAGVWSPFTCQRKGLPEQLKTVQLVTFLHQSWFDPLFIFSECIMFVIVNVGQSVLCFWPINLQQLLVVFIRG